AGGPSGHVRHREDEADDREREAAAERARDREARLRGVALLVTAHAEDPEPDRCDRRHERDHLADDGDERADDRERAEKEGGDPDAVPLRVVFLCHLLIMPDPGREPPRGFWATDKTAQRRRSPGRRRRQWIRWVRSGRSESRSARSPSSAASGRWASSA